MADVGCLIAPRPVLFENGRNDDGFPIAAAKKSFSHIARLYAALDATDRCDHDVFEGGHKFHGALAFDWIKRWL